MHDRLIQSIALVLIAAGIIGAFLLTPTINEERVQRQITYDMQVGDNANPAYAFGESLGSFRGILVNVLWQRAEKLKQEGKFYEANNLAQFITTLQPRYPEAWNFHGWNMAYNISVKCKTAEERWDWVQKGMALIRDRGIPNNPNAVVLYRSLGWILGHKMAGGTDDMHYYYKERWVETWQTLLGQPDLRERLKPEYTGDNRPTQEDFEPLKHVDFAATDQMRAIAGYADTYLLRPGRVEKAYTFDTTGKQEQSGKDRRDYNASNYFQTLSPDARARFFDDNPALVQVVRELEALTGPDGEELDLGLNTKTLRAFGRITLYRDAGYQINSPAVISNETVGVEGVAVKQWLDQTQRKALLVMAPFIDIERVREQVKAENPDADVIDLMPLLDLLRAQALIADYHMDPAYMVACMEKYGPIEWRHPSGHAVYWTALGTLRANKKTLNKDRIDFVNANRATIHALQNLAHEGKIVYRPAVEALGPYGKSRIHNASDTRMIPAYESAVTETKRLIDEGYFGDRHKNVDTYNRGHENFLQSAVVLYYFEGDEANARKYFKLAKDTYQNDEASVVANDGEYDLQLADFARVRLEDSLSYTTEQMIMFWIREAWRQGITSRDPSKMQRYLATGKVAYDKFLEDRQTTRRNDAGVQARQTIPPFGELVFVQFLEVMADPSYTMPQKSAVWRQGAGLLAGLEAEEPLAMVAYMQMMPRLAQQAEAAGWGEGWESLFPQPPGFQDWYERTQQPPDLPSPVRPGG